MTTHADLWRNRLLLPAYMVGEAASYAHISPQTVANWQKPNANSAAGPRKSGEGVSYFQLIEIAVVAAMRKTGVKLSAIKSAREYFKKKMGLDYPFVQAKFFSDGVNILIDDPEGLSDDEKLVAADINGQFIWSKFIYARLEEFDYGADGWVSSWKVNGTNSDIIIDPRVSFGKPAIRGVPTNILKGRWASGESLDDIADDYQITEREVKEALIFEGLVPEGIQKAASS